MAWTPRADARPDGLELDRRAVKDAVGAALLALGLSVPILALRTEQNMANQLVLQPALGLCRRRRGAARSGALLSSAGWRSALPPVAAITASRGPTGTRVRGRLSPARAAAGLPFLVLAARRTGGRHQVDRQFRHPDPDLRHARLGPQHRGRPRGPARSRLRRLLRRRRLCLRAARRTHLRLSASGSACRWPACWRPSGASCSAFRCCGCAATISPSSRSRSARSSASSSSTGSTFTSGYAGISGVPRRPFSACPSTPATQGFAAFFGSSSRRSTAPSSSST